MTHAWHFAIIMQSFQKKQEKDQEVPQRSGAPKGPTVPTVATTSAARSRDPLASLPDTARMAISQDFDPTLNEGTHCEEKISIFWTSHFTNSFNNKTFLFQNSRSKIVAIPASARRRVVARRT
jgi:hypothetical protein